MFGKKKLNGLEIYDVGETEYKRPSYSKTEKVKNFFGHVGVGLKEGGKLIGESYEKFEKKRNDPKFQNRLQGMNENFGNLIGDFDVRKTEAFNKKKR